MSRFEVKTTQSFEHKIIEIALECVAQNKVSMIIDKKVFDQMAVFIDQEPSKVLRVLTGKENSPLDGKTIYVGE